MQSKERWCVKKLSVIFSVIFPQHCCNLWSFHNPVVICNLSREARVAPVIGHLKAERETTNWLGIIVTSLPRDVWSSSTSLFQQKILNLTIAIGWLMMVMMMKILIDLIKRSPCQFWISLESDKQCVNWRWLYLERPVRPTWILWPLWKRYCRERYTILNWVWVLPELYKLKYDVMVRTHRPLKKCIFSRGSDKPKDLTGKARDKGLR